MDLSRFLQAARQGCVDPFHAARYHGKSSPPPAPDYVGAANAQGAANKDAAIASAQLSNPNIYGPYGSQTVSYANDPTTGNPVPTINQTLSPAQQQLLNSQTGMQQGLANLGTQSIGTVQNVLGTPFNSSGYNTQRSLDTSNVAQMPVNAGTTAQEAIMSRLEPQITKDREALRTQLYNQGLREGSAAYADAQTMQGQRENDLRLQAAGQGIGIDMGANQQGYNQALQSGQFANTANQQALQQAAALRQMPLNEITALMSGSQVTTPQFQSYTGQNVQAAPLFGAAQALGNYNQGIYNAEQAGQGAFYGGLASLGGALGGGAIKGGGWGNLFKW